MGIRARYKSVVQGDGIMEMYKRIFVIVLDSLGIGAMPDAARFADEGADTFGHILEASSLPRGASCGCGKRATEKIR